MQTKLVFLLLFSDKRIIDAIAAEVSAEYARAYNLFKEAKDTLLVETDPKEVFKKYSIFMFGIHSYIFLDIIMG
jgi:hypothetical protein